MPCCEYSYRVTLLPSNQFYRKEGGGKGPREAELKEGRGSLATPYKLQPPLQWLKFEGRGGEEDLLTNPQAAPHSTTSANETWSTLGRVESSGIGYRSYRQAVYRAAVASFLPALSAISVIINYTHTHRSLSFYTAGHLHVGATRSELPPFYSAVCGWSWCNAGMIRYVCYASRQRDYNKHTMKFTQWKIYPCMHSRHNIVIGKEAKLSLG